MTEVLRPIMNYNNASVMKNFSLSNPNSLNICAIFYLIF